VADTKKATPNSGVASFIFLVVEPNGPAFSAERALQGDRLERIDHFGVLAGAGVASDATPAHGAWCRVVVQEARSRKLPMSLQFP